MNAMLVDQNLFEHFLVVGTSPERAVDAARKMEQENRSFTSKMMQKIGEFVNGNRKTSAAQGSDTAEKGSVTTDSTSGEGMTSIICYSMKIVNLLRKILYFILLCYRIFS